MPRINTKFSEDSFVEIRNDAGDSLTVASNTYSIRATVDFGAGWSDKAQTVVTGQTWVTANSELTAQVLTPSGTDPDEMYLLGMRVEISDIVAGDGFTVTDYSETEARSTYTVLGWGPSDMAGAKIGFGSGVTELTGDTAGNAKVALPDASDPAFVGGIRVFAENDTGTVLGGDPRLVSYEADLDYRQRSAADVFLNGDDPS